MFCPILLELLIIWQIHVLKIQDDSTQEAMRLRLIEQAIKKKHKKKRKKLGL